jgi:diguanylate cyclase (GGDEF)-like protein/PAS domain S-box-containing protein
VASPHVGSDVPEPDGDPDTARPIDPVLVHLAATFDVVDDLVLVVDHRLVPAWANRAARRFLALGVDDDLTGRSLLDLLPPDDRDEYAVQVLDELAETDHWQGEVVLRRHDGVDVPHDQDVVAHRDADGRLSHLSAVARDVSGRRRIEARLEAEATHDAVTGLANRRLLVERVEQALSRGRRHGHEVVMCLVDLDGFGRVNDRLGYAAGDALLHEVGRRLRDAVRVEDVVGRVGGDEFVILCEDVRPAVDPAAIGRRVVELVSAPYELDAGEAVVGVSVGLVVAGPGAGDPDQLLRAVDEARYRATRPGHDQLEVVRLPPGY